MSQLSHQCSGAFREASGSFPLLFPDRFSTPPLPLVFEFSMRCLGSPCTAGRWEVKPGVPRPSYPLAGKAATERLLGVLCLTPHWRPQGQAAFLPHPHSLFQKRIRSPDCFWDINLLYLATRNVTTSGLGRFHETQRVTAAMRAFRSDFRRGQPHEFSVT
jgi:hypothetical protein